MSDYDMRQQEEMERERRERGLDALRRVEGWTHTTEDVLFIASELGLSAEFRRTQQRKAA